LRLGEDLRELRRSEDTHDEAKMEPVALETAEGAQQ